MSGVKITGKKSKRKHSDNFEGADSEQEIFLGITDMGNNSFEVWAHEECIVWSPGIHLIGPKIVGLEEAVWTCCNVNCAKCGLKGANICCLRRGCTSVAHFCCAKAADWHLDEDNFKSFCPEHKSQWRWCEFFYWLWNIIVINDWEPLYSFKSCFLWFDFWWNVFCIILFMPSHKKTLFFVIMFLTIGNLEWRQGFMQKV